jgi:FkbM family methyltransferase
MSKLSRLLTRLKGHRAFATLSYSQEGEDIVLKRLFGRISDRQGFYIEVGSHHPFRFSNTYLFYRAGWRGICIDPMPGSARAFARWRPRDLALELAIGEAPASMAYYMFNEPALNTFDASLVDHRLKSGDQYRIIGTRSVDVVPLSAITREHVPEGVDVDFISIDVEGLDLAVLRSNDWDRIRPKAVIVECLELDLHSLSRDPVGQFLSEKGYEPYAKTGNSLIFRR